MMWTRYALALLLVGCSSSEMRNPAPVPDPEPVVAWPTLACDALVPTYCTFPFPSNVFTVPDPASATGLVVALADEALPVATNGTTSTMAGQWTTDGFSTGGSIIAEMPGAIDEGLVPPDDPARSVADDSPTILIDAATLARVPHLSELDKRKPERDERTLIIRPLVRLADGTRYIVALRNVMGVERPLAPSPLFKALRDRQANAEADERRALYVDIFARLEEAGIARDNLQLAWDFTTASRSNNTAWLLHMRDEALAMAGSDGPPYVITDVSTDFDPRIAYRIEGTMQAPLYLDQPGTGARLTFGDDGMPEPNPTTPTVDVPFLVLIPVSATTTPAALLQYGHGLLGSKEQVESGNFLQMADEKGYVMFALRLDGMGDDDGGWIGERLASGDVNGLTAMFDRQHQGILQYLLAMRMMSRGFASDPTYGPFIDASARYYHGISQGGIFGATYMALSTDVTRGVLGVAGMSYSMLLERSVDFGPFFSLMNITFPDPRDQQFLVALVQMFWDRTEPNGYAPYIENDPLPDTPSHSVLIRTAVGDHQVTTLGGHLMARAVGATHLLSGVRDVYDLPTGTSLDTGSSYVEYDFGLPPEPLCNLPMTACEDPHNKIRKLSEADAQLDTFLKSGKSENFCPGGVCSFPDVSGCKEGEGTPFCVTYPLE